MSKQLLPGPIKETSTSDYRFDYFGQGVQWQIVQVQTDNDFIFTIVCQHDLFYQFFPSGEAKITEIFYKSKDAELERAERMFFQNMIDSCDIA